MNTNRTQIVAPPLTHASQSAGYAWDELATSPAGSREAAVRQYSLAQVLGVWAAAAVPMGALAWIVAPWVRDRLDGPEPMMRALLLCLTAGLIWQFVLVAILVGREVGTLRWARVRDALWLGPPQDPRTGHAGGRVWWWMLPFIVLYALEEFVPAVPAPSSRDFAEFLGSDRGEVFFQGAWGWFAVYVALALFNTVLGEELLFRGVLLPRMQRVFGRWDWVANGVLFAVYHLHMPWLIPGSLVDILALSYPSRRFRSAWMGIIAHSAQSVFFIFVLLALVLG